MSREAGVQIYVFVGADTEVECVPLPGHDKATLRLGIAGRTVIAAPADMARIANAITAFLAAPVAAEPDENG